MMGDGLGAEELKESPLLETANGMTDPNQSKRYEQDLLNTCEIYK